MIKNIYRSFLIPLFCILIGILPWWLLDKFLFKDQLYLALFNHSKIKLFCVLLMVCIPILIMWLAVARIPEKDRIEKTGLYFGKIIVATLCVELFILFIGGIVGVI